MPSETPKTSSELFAQVKAALCLCPEDWPGENEDGHRALRAIVEQLEAAREAISNCDGTCGSVWPLLHNDSEERPNGEHGSTPAKREDS